MREYVTERALQSPRSEGKEVLHVPEMGFPAAYGEDHGEVAVLLQSMNICGGAVIHLQLVEEPHTEAGVCPKEGWDPMESLYWNGLLRGTSRPMESGAYPGIDLLTGLVTLWGTPAGAVFSLSTAPCGKRCMLEQLMRSCSPWTGFILEKFVEGCLLWEGTPCWSRVWTLPEEEAMAETTCVQLAVTLIPRLPALLRGRR